MLLKREILVEGNAQVARRGRRHGRQKWENNIRKWTGLEFAKSQRAVENRENGCEIICGVPTTPTVKG